MASNASIASKALVHVCATLPDGSVSHPYYMDISHDQDTFHCKFITNARSADSDKKLFVYLILDATNVKAISLNGNDEVPPNVANEFVKQARCATAADLVSLQFTLTQNVPLVIPDLVLQYKPSSVTDIATLLRLGQCRSFTVHVPSESVNRERLSNLHDALDHRVIKPAERVIKTLYAGAGYKVVTHIDEIWSPNLPNPPPYDPSTAPGASNGESTFQPDPAPSNSSRGHGKRRSVSPDLLQNPSKRQLLTEKAVAQPWELAIAAQRAQIAALSAALSALREEVRQPQRAPGVDAETQTDSGIEHEPELSPEADPLYVAHTPASTVEDTIDDRFKMFEETIDDRFKMLEGTIDQKFDEKFDEKVEDRLLENEMNIMDEETLREGLDKKLESSNQQVCVHQKVSPLLFSPHEIAAILSIALHSVYSNARNIRGEPLVYYLTSPSRSNYIMPEAVKMHSPFSGAEASIESR